MRFLARLLLPHREPGFKNLFKKSKHGLMTLDIVQNDYSHLHSARALNRLQQSVRFLARLLLLLVAQSSRDV